MWSMGLENVINLKIMDILAVIILVFMYYYCIILLIILKIKLIIIIKHIFIGSFI